MKAEIRWQGDVCFEAESGSGHVVRVDGPPDHGGQNQGARPMELMLMGLGACSSFDVIHILRKSRQDVTDCRCQVTAERAEDQVPAVFTRIHLDFIVRGRGLKENQVSRAVSLSAEKYCSASIMLARGGVEISHSYTLEEEA